MLILSMSMTLAKQCHCHMATEAYFAINHGPTTMLKGGKMQLDMISSTNCKAARPKIWYTMSQLPWISGVMLLRREQHMALMNKHMLRLQVPRRAHDHLGQSNCSYKE